MPKGLMGQDMPSAHLSRLGLTVKAAILPGGKDSSLILHLGNFALCEQEWTEGEELALLVLLPEI